MNSELQNILNILEKNDKLSTEEKENLTSLIKKVDKEITILSFKLDRTEKVKRTTGILLEETIEELELKRKTIEESNAALKQSLDELRATQEQLIHSEKMASLGELTAGIAHEIQNPLNFVNNFSEVSNELIDEMKEELETGNLQLATEIADDVRQNLSIINHHGKRADEIVKGMLQHSRTTTGEKELTDINLLADEYLRLSYHGLKAKDQSFNADFKAELDESLPKINVIPQDIGRVLLNLINNAFYACVERSQSAVSSRDLAMVENYKQLVMVRTQNLDNHIEIMVKDNGDGIPDEIREKIFQPFFTTKPTGEGTGLGLSLSYDIITKGHGGKISLETKKGEGTTFTVLLPK